MNGKPATHDDRRLGASCGDMSQIPTQPVRAVLFDLSNTAIQYGQIDRRTVFEQAAWRTYRLWAQRQQRMPDFRRYYLHQWFALHWGHLKQVVFGREMNAMHYLRRACRKLWLSTPEPFFAELAQAWHQPLAELPRVEPGTYEVLATLRACGHQLALVSNTFVPDFVLDRHLSQLDLLQYFLLRIYSCAVGYRKPNRRIFHAALDRLGAKPHETAFVGDQIHADVRGAHRAGMNAIWKRSRATRHRMPPPNVPIVDRFHQLLDTQILRRNTDLPIDPYSDEARNREMDTRASQTA